MKVHHGLSGHRISVVDQIDSLRVQRTYLRLSDSLSAAHDFAQNVFRNVEQIGEMLLADHQGMP